MEAEHCTCTGQPSLPELCHFGFRKWGLWRSYIFIRYIRGNLNRATGLLWDLLLPICRGHLHWQGAMQITSMIKWTPRVLMNMFACYTHLSAGAEAGGAGLLGVVGDGCSCFSMVNLTSSCSKTISTDNVRIIEGYKKNCQHFHHGLPLLHLALPWWHWWQMPHFPCPPSRCHPASPGLPNG